VPRTDLIGIAGGHGAVGSALVTHLLALGFERLRIGSRRASDSPPDPRIEWVGLEIGDPQSLGKFCTGCRVIVNCAGPFSRIGDRVARAAALAGADYIDPGGDEPLYDQLVRDNHFDKRRVLLSAGLMPGLTGLLPRWLARQGFDTVVRLTAHVCLRDRFTPAAAIDYLFSLRGTYGEPLAAWRGGALVPRALQPVIGTELPLFPERVNVYPYFTKEAERLAHALSLKEASCYTIIDGDHVWPLLGRVRLGFSEQEEAGLARELARAAEIDLFGRIPLQTLVFCLDGECNSVPMSRTLIVRSASTYRVTSALCAVAVQATVTNGPGCGVHFAADVMDPATTVSTIRDLGCWTCFELLEEPALQGSEQGIL
jgi:NAD dependent epimerase/dehydratase family